MRFSSLLSQLSGVGDSTLRHLADDPEIGGADALDAAGSGQLSFLEPGNALAASLAATGASAVLLPIDTALQEPLDLFSGGLTSLGAEAMVALLEAQGAVGLGDQPIAADQGVTALPKPVEGEGAPFLGCQQRNHHAGVEINHQ